jgi:hypothetical protein
METEDIAVRVGTVVEGSDQVFERGAGVVRKFLEENLGLFLSEWTHAIWDLQACFTKEITPGSMRTSNSRSGQLLDVETFFSAREVFRESTPHIRES